MNTNDKGQNYSYKIRKNVKMDATNYWGACNSHTHGTNWKEKMPEEVAARIEGKSKEEAFTFLVPFLEEKHSVGRKPLERSRAFFKKEFDKKFEEGCEKIERVMGSHFIGKTLQFILQPCPEDPTIRKLAHFGFVIPGKTR